MGCFGKKNLSEFRTVYANQRSPTSDADVVVVQSLHNTYANNVVVTSKYEYWNFIPKNLFEQFRRVANFYFLCVVIVQFSIIDRTPVTPATSLLPLVFVIAVTAVKQFYEDLLRKRADREVNNRETIIVQNSGDKTVYSKDIKVGDIVKVRNDEEIPCDLVVLSTSEPDGQCHIMTANLDGETNLKTRTALPVTSGMTTTKELYNMKAVVECDHPEYDMYKYNGRLTYYPGGRNEKSVHSLSISNLLLRGAKIKQTEYAYGLAVYTGKETKMALNQKEKTYKFSVIEKKMNVYLLFYLIILIVIASVFTALKFKWEEEHETHKYIFQEKTVVNAGEVVINLLSFLILFNYIIPISLYVTIELQKFCGAQFFNWDLELYHEPTDDPAKANTSDLMEELGQIEYVFSDKTGTLTENDMQFRQCSINGVKWEEIEESTLKNIVGETYDKSAVMDKKMQDFFVALALCHTVQADAKTEKSSELDESDGADNPLVERIQTTVYTYQASSPDEKALCEAASKYGVVYRGKSGDYMELDVCGKPERYKVLHVLEFDSTRKRMSVILEQESVKNEVLMLCKGAESHVMPRCIAGHTPETLEHINDYAKLGLRTLAISCRRLPRSIYEEIDAKLTEAQQSITDREEQLAKVFDEVEKDLELLGATAVEDKLQDQVKETIDSLREAGIKVWVLTGDKQETAVNISHSCGHFHTEMNLETVTQRKSVEDAVSGLDKVSAILKSQKEENNEKENALIIDGSTLAYVLPDPFATEKFVTVSRQCVAVLCCRMSPLQKAEVVKLVKNCKDKPITLAIGDGANDCSMIQEANVGCGIMGKEGRQAVRCSDYAFHRFKYLKRVLLVHGHYYYTRLSNTVQYFFYKNVVFMVPQILYQVLNGFSTLPLYASVFLTCFNIFFTSLPVLFYGIFEKHLKPETLHANPKLYKDIAKNHKLTWKVFGLWFLSGFWHGLVIYYGVKRLYGESSFNSGLLDYGLFTFGTFTFTIVIIVSNLKIALLIHYWTWFMHLFVWGSILFYLFFVLILCGFPWPWQWVRDAFNLDMDMDLYWIIYMLFDSYSFWLAVIMITWIALLPDILINVLMKAFMPSPTDECQINELDTHGGHGNQVSDAAVNGGYVSSSLNIKSQFEKDDVELLSITKIKTTTV